MIQRMIPGIQFVHFSQAGQCRVSISQRSERVTGLGEVDFGAEQK